MQELRHNTQQTVRVGVLIGKRVRLTDPWNPILGALLSWYYWKYLIKSDGTVVSIASYNWQNAPNCNGCYFLTIPAAVCNMLGSLILYIFDSTGLEYPIFMEFNVVTQNEWDSKYGSKYLTVEQDSKLG